MAVVGVLAKARVGDRHERQLEGADPSEGILDDPVVVRGLGAERVLRRRQAEQDDPTDPELGQATGLLGGHVGRHPLDPGHRGDRLAHPRARTDEERGDQHRRMQARLPDQGPECRRAPQPAGSHGQRGHRHVRG